MEFVELDPLLRSHLVDLGARVSGTWNMELLAHRGRPALLERQLHDHLVRFCEQASDRNGARCMTPRPFLYRLFRFASPSSACCASAAAELAEFDAAQRTMTRTLPFQRSAELAPCPQVREKWTY